MKGIYKVLEEEDRMEERKGTYCLIERMIVGLFLEYKDNFLEGRHEREGGAVEEMGMVIFWGV